jgi:endonuclease/exonuclease/phosphatase family metal-dependent hydrolase
LSPLGPTIGTLTGVKVRPRARGWSQIGHRVGASDLANELSRHRLLDAPALRHLGDALERDDATVAELLRPGHPFRRAPDPSAWLRHMQTAANPEMRRGSRPLSLLTYNVGLLSRRVALQRFEVPHPTLRRARLPAEVLAGTWDVVMLQEVWEQEDVQAFATEARRQGYAFFAGARRHAAHGLMILVRRSLIDTTRPQRFEEHCYGAQRRAERLPGLGIARGYLSWTLGLRDAGQIVLIDTHTTAFPPFSHVRAAQACELATAVRRQAEDAVVIVGGDLNAGPYYPSDQYGWRAGSPVSGWWRNAVSYPLLLHLGALQDAVVAAGLADDVQAMAGVPIADPGFADRPFGGEADPDVARRCFTATDANSLYHRQYGGTEYPARIDHVLWRDHRQTTRVAGARLCFVERHEFPGVGQFELSDHYGVEVQFEVCGDRAT